MTERRTIVIADDNLQIRMLVKAALASLGHELVEAVDGEQALDVVTTHPPDLLLLDVNMPKLDGWEVLHFMRRRPETAAVPVMMLTTEAQVWDLKRAASLGCDDYLIKPFAPRELKERVGHILEGWSADS